MSLDVGGYPSKAPLRSGKGVAEPVVVLVTDGNYFRQATICHPIGITKLSKDGWVFFDSNEVKSTVAAEKDPSASKKETVLRNVRFKVLTDLHEMELDGERLKYAAKDGGRMYDVVEAEAKASLAAAAARAKAEYLAEMAQNGKTPKKDWKFGHSVAAYWPSQEAAAEARFKDILKSNPTYQAALKGVAEYETRVGPMQDRPQVLAALPDLSGTVQLVDSVFSALKADFDGTRLGKCPGRAKVSAAFKQAGDDPAKLKEFIFSFAFPYLKT